MGRAALDNPDLPVSFITEALVALAEPERRRRIIHDEPDDGDAARSEAPLSARFYGRRVELARLRSSNAPATYFR